MFSGYFSHVFVLTELYMYVCIVITYRKKNQSGKVADPARGQLNREN